MIPYNLTTFHMLNFQGSVFVAVLSAMAKQPVARPHALYYCFVFRRNHFIDVYCHMVIAALEFMLRR